MKRCIAIGSFVALAAFAQAGQFKSVFITGNHGPVHILDNELMVIRNFTQDTAGSSRGYVTFNNRDSDRINVLTASIIDSTAPEGSQEVINSIIIAGPAIVNFHCEDTGARCFATFKIDSN